MTELYTYKFKSNFKLTTERKFKVCVIDANYLFADLYKKAVQRQRKLYAAPGNFSHIYLNNYAIILDRFFNMYGNWRMLKKKLIETHSIEKFVIVYDKSIYNADSKYRCYYYSTHEKRYVGSWNIARLVLNSYYLLKPLLTKVEIIKYSKIEDYVSKIHPRLFDEKYVDFRERIFKTPSRAKYWIRNKLFNWVQILQARATPREYQEIINLLLTYINEETNTRVFESSASLIEHYSAAEVAACISRKSEQNKTLLYSNRFVCSPNLYGTKDFVEFRVINKYKNIPNINKPDTKRWRNHDKNVWNLWNVAQDEFLNYILDVNRFNTFNIFPPRAGKYSVYMVQYNDHPVDYNTWRKITEDAINHFNKVFFTFLII